MEIEGNVPKPESVGINPFYVFIYLVVFAGIFVFPGFVFSFSLDGYSWTNISTLYLFLVPAFLFSVVGIMTVRRKYSILWALIFAAIAFGVIWKMGWGDMTLCC
ncbi:MAG: hypothetical protein ABID64_03635 [Nitrospirota bacterium]